MHYSIAAPIYLAELENDVILLDVAAQRYKLLPCVEEKPFSPPRFFTALLAGMPIQEEPYQEALETCLKAGWICEDASDGVMQDPLSLPRYWLSKFSLCLEALILLHRIDGFIRRQQFLPLIQALMALPTQPGTRTRQRDRIIRAVREMAHTFRQPKTCLNQSLVICWMLRSRGIQAQVAIRVQQHPLSSHMIVV
ncbi:MAG TPA: lasso peptide biosynthesis B2 protein, partial [Ktedonobacteraceae bacterium]